MSLTAATVSNRAASAQDFAPKQKPLAIAVAPRSGLSLECKVPFGPAAPISSVAFSVDGKTLAVGGYSEVLLWDLANAKLSKRLGTGVLGTTIGALVFMPDGKSLAVGEGTPGSSGAVRILDLESGKPTISFEEPADVVSSLAISPDGKLLAAGGAYTPVHVWNLAEKKLATTIKRHTDRVSSVGFSLDGKFLVTAGADRNAWVWDVATWESKAKLLQTEAVRGATFDKTGTYVILSVGGAKTWYVQAQRRDNPQSKRVYYGLGGMPLDAVLAPKANRIVIPCADNTTRIHDGSNGRPLLTLSGHDDWVWCAAVNPAETVVASGSADGTVKLFNLKDGKLLATLVQLAPRSDQYLAITAQGYLAASDASRLTWQTTTVKTPAAEITGILQKPELVGKTIAGEKVEPPALN